ncbi:MAG TPA: sigma-70 family RNA polymerase sigma factor [Planctomycetota bacterium]|nr:sigma-70 family RNA polymerase sigma factor [Planctomycetota bacterium]
MPALDRDAFARLWMAAEPAVIGFVGALVRDHGAVDDLVQEVATDAWAKADRYDPTAASFTSWCLGMARIAVLRSRRAAGRTPILLQGDLIETVARESEDLASELDERAHALRDCVRALGEKAARLLRLRYVEALTPAAIAAREGVEANAVRVGLHRIRTVLETCIRRRGAR